MIHRSNAGRTPQVNFDVLRHWARTCLLVPMLVLGCANGASDGTGSVGTGGGAARGASGTGGAAAGTGGAVGSGGDIASTGGNGTGGAAAGSAGSGGSGGGVSTDAAVGDAQATGDGVGAEDAGSNGDRGASTGGRGGGTGAAGGNGGGRVVISPVPNGYQAISSYPAPAEATRKAGVPRATLDTFVYTSPFVFGRGQAGPTVRNVHVFIPAQYVAGTEVPFMVIHDGDEQLVSFHTDIVLENLIFQKKLPVMVALFVNRPTTTSTTQRSLEYDCIDADYSNFVMNEILPEVKRRHPELNLTSDPNGRATMGKSSGAVAAFTMAWLHPELYQRVLTFNGSFRNQCADGTGALGYPDAIRAANPAKPLRVYLFSGSGDLTGYAAANQAMADALQAKGTPWRFVYGNGATHSNTYASSLVTEALLWVWAGYPL